MAKPIDHNREVIESETIGSPPGFISEETPAMDASAEAWRAHLAWLRRLPPDAELRDQRISDAELKVRELTRGSRVSTDDEAGERR